STEPILDGAAPAYELATCCGAEGAARTLPHERQACSECILALGDRSDEGRVFREPDEADTVPVAADRCAEERTPPAGVRPCHAARRPPVRRSHRERRAPRVFPDDVRAERGSADEGAHVLLRPRERQPEVRPKRVPRAIRPVVV